MNFLIKMLSRLFIIFIVFDIISLGFVAANKTNPKPIDFDKAKEDMVTTFKRQYKEFKLASQQFKKVVEEQKNYLKGVYKNLTDTLTFYLNVPHEDENKLVDNALAEFFPVGGDNAKFVDTEEKFTEFCNKSEERLDLIKSWVRRSFRYNVIVQVATQMVLGKLAEKTKVYCANKTSFVKNVQQIKQINSKLIPVKDQLLDSMVSIQNSTYRFTKIGNLCCSLWAFRKGTLSAVQNGTEVKEFMTDMIDEYFGGASKYLCFFYPKGSDVCEDIGTPVKASHPHKSLLYEGIMTLSKLVSLRS